MTSLKRWKGSTFLLVPVIAGLLFAGFPVKSGVAQVLDIQEEARRLAREAGLESLRLAIQNDAALGLGQPLLLNPELGPRNVPLPGNLQDFLNPQNPNARLVATQLGKALFWDQAIGSDGQACASCHFHAGADNRPKNSLNPNLTRVENARDAVLPDIIGFHFAQGAGDETFDDPNPNPPAGFGPNYTLQPEDFPFVKNIGNGDNVVDPLALFIEPAPGNTNDVASSQGVFFTQFESVVRPNVNNPFALGSDPANIRDRGEPIADLFNVGGINVRRVEPRNTPTTINSVFNVHNFWDGRANNRFNGVNPFGDTDRNARIFVRGNGPGVATRNISLTNASLASQAVGPPLSHFEMSFGNPGDNNPNDPNDPGNFNDRIWPDIGKKMVGIPSQFAPRRAPETTRYLLEAQNVHFRDSLLGALKQQYGPVSRNPNRGIRVTYKQLIQEAFNPNLWDSDQTIIFPSAQVTSIQANNVFQDLGAPRAVTGDQAQALVQGGVLATERVFSLMEANFSFFFGLSVMLYEAELVADQSRFDQFMQGDVNFTNVEIFGLLVFIGRNIPGTVFANLRNGGCINCHSGPELTNASVREVRDPLGNVIALIEPMIMGNGQPAFYDTGFYNIGVTPTPEDLGRGGKGPEDKPLASSRQFLFQDQGIQNIDFPIIGLPIGNLAQGDCLGPFDPVTLACLDQRELFRVNPGEPRILVCIDRAPLDGVCDVNDDIQLFRVANDGAFKTPGLRNIELTGPYMHNGSLKTLLEVVEFYDRGGNFCRLNFNDLDPGIVFLGLRGFEERGLVRFLLSLTDTRLQRKRAPFDHPELRIPNGHTVFPDPLFAGQAQDDPLTLPAVGVAGVKFADRIRAFHVQLGMPDTDAFRGHFVAGEVLSDNLGPNGAPMCVPQ